MSPEQVRGKELDARTDLFSFGAVLYEMCTGALPFRGETSGVIFESILNRAPAPAVRSNPNVPAKLEEVVIKALEKDRDVRYQHASDIKADLKRVKRDLESGSISSSDNARPLRARRTMLISAIALVSIVALIAVGALHFGSSTSTRINSVAVLPFSNATGDPSADYLSDGITEGVIDRLSGLPDLKVISRTSAFHYKGRDIEPQRVAKELGVEALVTGRVVQHGDDLSVSTELVDAREDKQLWGEQYTRKVADIHIVQQDIATAISGNLRLHLSSEQKTRLAKSRTTNTESYQLYVKGLYHANKASAEGLNQAVGYFQQSIEQDPSNASCLRGDGPMLCRPTPRSAMHPDRTFFPKQWRPPPRRSLCDASLADAHAALGYAKFAYKMDWAGAETELKRAD